jgi:transcriptional regulator with XRE-family HTH domain
MAEDDPGPLATELRRLMTEADIGQKALALKAKVNETYVRDILKGKSRNPEAAKLARVAEALGVPAAALLNAAGAPKALELVEDPEELVLLRAWRELPDGEKQGVRDYIRFRLSQLGRPITA